MVGQPQYVWTAQYTNWLVRWVTKDFSLTAALGNSSDLTFKHQETHGCVVSTVAKAPGHQYPQYWLNIQFIGPVSYESITLLLDNIQK